MPQTGHRKRVRHWNHPGHAHELTFSCHKRLPMLNNDRTRRWLVDALHRVREVHDVRLWAYVIMPEHAHVLILPNRPAYDIASILKSAKQAVSRRAINHLRKHAPAWLDRLRVIRPNGRVEHRFWLQGPGYDRNADNFETVRLMAEYMHSNPLRRGLVDKSTDYVWSSARWYAGYDDVPLAMDPIE